jgi:hypothetical protein
VGQHQERIAITIQRFGKDGKRKTQQVAATIYMRVIANETQLSALASRLGHAALNWYTDDLQ